MTKGIMVLSVCAGFALLIAIAASCGSHRWKKKTDALRDRLSASRCAITPAHYESAAIENLPLPVTRYFADALGDTRLMIQSVTLEQTGSFNLGGNGSRWKPFSAIQRISVRRPGFDWYAKLSVLPFVKVHVHDALVEGEGIFSSSVAGFFSITDLRGTDDIARNEFMRFIAETPWYPTALLPSQGVVWKEHDDRSAFATFTDGALTLTLLFRFNKQNMIESVRAESRGRMIDGKSELHPWEGRWSGYTRIHGIMVPTDGEAVWILPQGEHSYWRGHVTKIDFEFAE